MKKGFDRLRGVAAASAMGLGLLGGAGSVRALTVTTKTRVGFNTNTWYSSTSSSTIVAHPTEWRGIGNLHNVMGNQSITTAGGFALTIGQTAFGISSAVHRHYAYAYDGAGSMSLAVGNNLFVNPDNTVDLTDNTLTTDIVTNIIAGVNAQIQYHFMERTSLNTAVVRALYSVTNTTGAPISTSMLVMGNYGSNATTTVHGTSDGDLIVEANDYWVASNRYTEPGGMTYVSAIDTVISSHGAGAAVVPVITMTLGSPTGGSGMIDNFGYRYDVTIQAGSTVRVMLFNELSEVMTQALAAAPDFESLDAAGTAGLLTGLSSTQLSEIVNYAAVTDTDSDGVGDNADAFPTNIAASVDADNDGLPDAWNAACNAACQAGSGLMLDASLDDTDNDGVINGSDAFPNDSTETVDSDGDGVGDNADAFPNNATETVDSDGDGVGDNADAFPTDATRSAAAGGSPGAAAPGADADLDGVLDADDAFPNDATETVDSDGDGVGDNADAFPTDATRSAGAGGSSGADADLDGVLDANDAFPNDATETVDSDGDGVGDNTDAFPSDSTETVDSDGDSIGDNTDAFPNDSTETVDSDDDGVGDNADAFPTDATETVDSDGDGVGDNADAFPADATETLDSDSDGVGDNADAFPTDATRSALAGDSSGAVGPTGLLALSGLPVLLRRRKNKAD